MGVSFFNILCLHNTFDFALFCEMLHFLCVLNIYIKLIWIGSKLHKNALFICSGGKCFIDLYQTKNN